MGMNFSQIIKFAYKNVQLKIISQQVFICFFLMQLFQVRKVASTHRYDDITYSNIKMNTTIGNLFRVWQFDYIKLFFVSQQQHTTKNSIGKSLTTILIN